MSKKDLRDSPDSITTSVRVSLGSLAKLASILKGKYKIDSIASRGALINASVEYLIGLFEMHGVVPEDKIRTTEEALLVLQTYQIDLPRKGRAKRQIDRALKEQLLDASEIDSFFEETTTDEEEHLKDLFGNTSEVGTSGEEGEEVD